MGGVGVDYPSRLIIIILPSLGVRGREGVVDPSTGRDRGVQCVVDPRAGGGGGVVRGEDGVQDLGVGGGGSAQPFAGQSDWARAGQLGGDTLPCWSEVVLRLEGVGGGGGGDEVDVGQRVLVWADLHLVLHQRVWVVGAVRQGNNSVVPQWGLINWLHEHNRDFILVLPNTLGVMKYVLQAATKP